MAERPIFIVKNIIEDKKFIEEVLVDFKWFSGFAVSQKQKSIHSLHTSAMEKLGDVRLLEISSKSECKLGVDLSAFNLLIKHKKTGEKFSVESAFQSSKIFESGGPYLDLLGKESIEAKKDLRLKNSGKLKAFSFFGTLWPLEPKTLFYDWLYINALNQNRELLIKLVKYDGFSDIEFNHNKSINCQARSAALAVSLYKSNLLDESLESITKYKEIISNFQNEIHDEYKQLDFLNF